MKDIKKLLLDKLETISIMNKNSILFFDGEIKKILKYIEELENKK